MMHHRLFKIPTKQMIELLMDCHERELMHMPPPEAGTTYHSAGLISRDFLTIIKCNDKGRIYYGLVTTQEGRHFLEEYTSS